LAASAGTSASSCARVSASSVWLHGAEGLVARHCAMKSSCASAAAVMLVPYFFVVVG
jgi:hypothetical protein